MAIIIYLQKNIRDFLLVIRPETRFHVSDSFRLAENIPAFKGSEEMIELDFDKQGGVVPAIAQDCITGEVLMLAYMDREALELTLSTGIAHYYSRSRKRIWKKGESSGNIQNVKEVRVDCDTDTLLIKVDQTGAACHEGYRSCFFRVIDGDSLRIDRERLIDPEELYGKSK